MSRLLGALGLALMVSAIACSAVVALPPGRHYEMVSPEYKGGYGVALHGIEAAAMSGGWEGNHLLFISLGTFAGAPNHQLFDYYLAQRSPAGWSTTPVIVPAALAAATGAAHEFPPGLEWALFEPSVRGENAGAAEALGAEPEFLTHNLSLPDTAPNAPELAPNFELAGVPLKRIDGKRVVATFVGLETVSANLCRLLFRTAFGNLEPEPLLEESLGTRFDLYEMTSGAPGCGGERRLRLVGVGNTLGPHGEPAPISLTCSVELGASVIGGNSYNAVSADGSEVFFTANPNIVASRRECDGSAGSFPSNPATLYVRLNGERTVDVSAPLPSECVSGPCMTAAQQRAVFVGASEDGSKAFFLTKQPLVTGDTDGGEDVYMAKIGCPTGEPGCEPAKREVTSLVQVSHDPSGEAAEVQGVVDVASGGERVYFVARGVLGEEGPTSEGAQTKAIPGADNLYVYDAREGDVRFIADLCSGPGESGLRPDGRCPSSVKAAGAEASDASLWEQSSHAEAQLGDPVGRYLVFSAYGQLASGDTDNARDVYRYDAQERSLERVSLGEGEFDANGNRDGLDSTIPQLNQTRSLSHDYELDYRTISEDGSRVLFESAEPLAAAATNGLLNAYEWHDGEVSLVSSGNDEEAIGAGSTGVREGEVVITPSGRDVFFITVQGLLSQDVDGARDIYDARLGEGLAEAPAPGEPCSGDACQGPLTSPAPVIEPGSLLQAPGENLAPPSRKAVTHKKPGAKRRRIKKRSKSKKARRGRRDKSGGLR